MDVQSRQTEVDELGKKILIGLQRAIRELVETAAANNRNLIVGDENGKSISVPAKELLRQIKK